MNKLFKIYVTGILLIIFGQLINGASGSVGGYGIFISGVLTALLFAVSVKPELMKKGDFLFAQLGLMIVFFLIEIINYIIIFYYVCIIKNCTTGILTPLQVVLVKLIPILGYLITILCLINFVSRKNE